MDMMSDSSFYPEPTPIRSHLSLNILANRSWLESGAFGLSYQPSDRNNTKHSSQARTKAEDQLSEKLPVSVE